MRAGVPSVTVRPDMFGFVQGGRPTPSSSIRDLGETLMIHLCCPAEQRLLNEAALVFFGFFFFFVPPLSEAPLSQPLVFISSFTERSRGNRRSRLQASHVTWISGVFYSRDETSCSPKAKCVMFKRDPLAQRGKYEICLRFILFFFFKVSLLKACLNTVLPLHQILIWLFEMASFGAIKKQASEDNKGE